MIGHVVVIEPPAAGTYALKNIEKQWIKHWYLSKIQHKFIVEYSTMTYALSIVFQCFSNVTCQLVIEQPVSSTFQSLLNCEQILQNPLIPQRMPDQTAC